MQRIIRKILVSLYLKLRKYLEIDNGNKWARPGTLHSITKRFRTSCGKIFLTCAWDNNGQPREVYFQSGSEGCQGGQAAQGRLVSLALRYNVPLDEVIEQCKQVKCGQSMRKLGLLVNDETTPNHKKIEYCKSCAESIVRILEEVKNK